MNTQEKFNTRRLLKEQGEYFRRLRKQRKLTQLQVADLVGISQAIISHIECGFFMPSPELESALLDIYRNT